ncbi:hypothetical protein [uncultured Brachyspira sp.]|uniref:hypothetical protein n=1 Tax=uncultured Brachyspira sp. TaxID=221953 RepID=UPI0025D6FE40|nr:hypothetical protein [uncultured Brachyspira sp.]
MSFDFKLIVRDKYSEKIFDIMNTAESIKAGDIKTDYKAADGNRISSIKLGIGNISSGRSFNIGIPIYEYKDGLGSWVRIEEQYSKYTGMILSGNIKRYFIRTVFENEIYEAEYIIKSVSGYNIKYINNLGVAYISLEALDKVFLRQKEEEYEISVTEDNKQDINYKSLSLVPVPLSFNLQFLVSGGMLDFLFANRDNFGVQCKAELRNGVYNADFNGERLTINGVAYNYKGIRPELNAGINVFYLESNQTCIKASIRYRRGILI